MLLLGLQHPLGSDMSVACLLAPTPFRSSSAATSRPW